jgi:DNA-binding transcriptional LysR family regulator
MERLDLRLVEYFVAVAEELHFGRAAARLHIAQPSLSQQIRRLEERLGVTLLERTSRRVELTPAGEALLREGRTTLDQSRRAVHAVRAAAHERITVGFYGSAASELLPQVLSAFAELHPGIDVSVRELLMGSVAEILDGQVDVAFTRLLPDQTEAEVEVIAREPRVLALPAAHPLAARRSLRFADLREQSFITNPAVHEGRPPPRWLAEQHRHGLPGRVAAQAASVQEILTLVAAGRGVCLVPAPVAKHHPRSDVSFVPVTDAAPAVVSLAWRRDSLGRAAQLFVETARAAA